MKLGNDTIGLRTFQARLDGGGDPVRDEFGDVVKDQVDVEVRWCLVTPTGRRVDTTEPDDRAAPALTGVTAFVPPPQLRQLGVELTKASVLVWPITGRTGSTETSDLALDGRTWQVIGEPGDWGDTVEVRLRAAT